MTFLQQQTRQAGMPEQFVGFCPQGHAHEYGNCAMIFSSKWIFGPGKRAFSGLHVIAMRTRGMLIISQISLHACSIL